jgi:hypothetical protein
MPDSKKSPISIVDLTTICNSFPELQAPQIERQVFLDTIDDLFSTKNIVVVEGKEGVGKTTLLAQYAKRYPEYCISLFIRPANRYSYDLDILTLDLGNQINWVLNNEELGPLFEVSESLLRKYIFALGRRAHRTHEKFVFIIDGLYDIPSQDAITQEQILELLPFGNSKFKFLLSSRSEDLDIERVIKESVKAVLLGGFSLEETRNYFADYDLDDTSIKELHKVLGKNPSYLASVRRILDSGTNIHDLLDDLPRNLPNLFEIEWQYVSEDPDEQLVLSIIAHDTRRHSIEVLGNLANLSTQRIHEILSKHGFISIETDGVCFISEAMRRFATRKVSYPKDKIIDLIITKLLNRDAESPQSSLVNSLPNYLYEGNKFIELINYLSDDYFSDALMASQSMSFIRRMASLGVETAKKLQNDLAVIRFSVYSSLISELSIAETWRSEVEALMELDDYDGSLSLAQSAKLKEDRLHLLAVIARKKKEQEEAPEAELLEQIRNLHSQVDYRGLSEERATEIALDLLYSIPDIAIEIIEKSQNVTDSPDMLDWALARLSFEALRSEANENSPNATSEKIRSRIKDPSVKKLSSEISLMLQKYTSDDILSEVDKLDNVSDKLYLLRHWTASNREDIKAADVIEYALQLIVQTTAYTPNAKLFRELASPLPNIADVAKLKHLIGKFDSQKAFCEQYGPTEDYVRLQLVLARAEIKIDLIDTENRVLDIYYYISGLQDHLIKAECMSRLLAALHTIDQPQIFENKHGLHTVAEVDLKDYFRQLLDSSADQYVASKRIIRALAKKCPQLAMDFALSLNSQDRRDEALSDVVDSLLHTSDERLDLISVETTISEIKSVDSKDDEVLDTLHRLSRIETKDDRVFNEAKPILSRSVQIRDAGERCQALCYIIQFHVSQEKTLDDVLTFDLLKLLEDSYHAVDVIWHKVDTGFRIAQSITKYSKDLANQYLRLSQRFKKENILCNETLATAYVGCLRLGIRAFSGLLSNDIDKEDDLIYLSNLISRIPSHGQQAELWSEVALHHFLNKKTDVGKKIVSDYIRPLIEEIPIDDTFHRDEVAAFVSPSMYLDNRTIALDIISKLSRYHQYKAYTLICQFYLRKRPLSDPYDSAGTTYKISYDDTLEVCEIIPKLQVDGAIYHFIATICEGLERTSSTLNRNQKLDIISRLEVITANNFPSVDGIQHDGYKIVSLAQIYRLKKVKPSDWQDLANHARSLPNSADRAFVLCAIAEAMPSNRANDRRSLLEEAEKITEQIPSIVDRAEHYELLATKAVHIDTNFTKRMLDLAMKTTVISDDPEMDSVQRKIVDLAYRIDPDLASSLSSITDDDPARIRAKMVVDERLTALQLKQTLVSGEKSDSDRRYYGRACSMYLAALNAGRVNTLHPDNVENLLSVIPELPLRRAYSILALITQNFVTRYAHDKQGGRYIKPYFDVSLLSAQLVENVANRVLRDIEKDSKQVVLDAKPTSILVEPGQREKGIDFIKDWLTSSVSDYLIICDGYFSVDDLEVIKLVASINPACSIEILTSLQHQKKEGIEQPWSNAYRTYWNFKISDAPPPDTTITVAGIQGSENLPIHDRWWLTKGTGLRLGTSLNGLGGRSSEISLVESDVAEVMEQEVRQYLSRTKKNHKGERILYEVFTL